MRKKAETGFFAFISTFFSVKSGLNVVFFIFLSSFLQGQEIDKQTDIQQLVQVIIEDFTEFNDGGADFDFNTLYEDLIQLYTNRLDINTASTEDLSQLIFLTDADIQNIVSYRTTYGPFLSIYELQSVPGLTIDKLSNLRYFIKLKSQQQVSTNTQLKELNRSKDQLFIKWRYNIETAVNFQSINGSEPKYIGDKHHMYLRYSHSTSQHKYGLIMEKDPGEKYFNEYSETGIEYLSLHYEQKNPTSWIEQLNIGDYSVSLGQGLIAHSAFGIGKSSLTTRVKKSRKNLKAYTSVAENLAFRGVAAKIAPQDSRLSGMLFGSYVPRDANLDSDSLAVSFSSLPEGGFHRTTGERIDQDGIYEFTTGGNLNYRFNDRLRLGVNAIHHGFDKKFESNLQPYQIYRWQGNQISNFSADYDVRVEGWNIYGELARSSTDGWAQMHGLIKTLDPSFDVSVVYRNYTPEYQALYANGFGESNSVNNERGIYLGMEYRPSKNWTVKAFVDQWKNEWLRFRVDGPANGREYLLRVDYKEKRKRHFYMQYRYERKGENSDEDLLVDLPVNKITQRLRFHASHNLNKGIELRSRLEMSLFQKEGKTDRGILIYQDFISRKQDSPLTLNARLAYFDISDFDARIYTYENDLLFEYYIPSFSGRGIRYYVHCRYNISRHLMAEFRWEQTKFFGAEAVGVNEDLILGSTASRIKAQIRWRF